MTDDLDKLVRDLDIAGPKAQAATFREVRLQAARMRTHWRRTVSGARGFPHLGRAVSYDVHIAGLRSIEAEVGYERRGQGELGNIAEFGTSTQAPKRPAGARVLKNGADRLEKHLHGLDPL